MVMQTLMLLRFEGTKTGSGVLESTFAGVIWGKYYLKLPNEKCCLSWKLVSLMSRDISPWGVERNWALGALWLAGFEADPLEQSSVMEDDFLSSLL